jgi:PAT family beta-lactamase induction signal transducer AmpG
MNRGAAARLGLLAALYLSQGLPYGFFTQALPVLLREMGASLPAIGLTSLLALPWAFKFLWAPWLDRRPLRVFGRGLAGLRRSFIVPLQALSAAAMAVCAFIDPTTMMPVLLGAVLVINLLAATQDIATDGLAVQLLPAEERGWGNGIQVAGYRVGMILSGGALLLVLDRVGWQAAFVGMAALIAVATVPVLVHREAPAAFAPERLGGGRAWLEALRSLLTRPGMLPWLLLLVVYKAGDAFAVGMLRPFLVDAGRSLEQVGWMLGVVGFTTGLIGAVLGGWAAGRFGRVPALVGCGAFQVLAAAAYIPCALGTVSDAALAAVVGLDHLAGGMATVALFTMMMDTSRLDHAGTDYTVQASVVVFASGVGAALAGVSAEALGHAGHFGLGALLSGAGLAYAALRARGLHAELASHAAIDLAASTPDAPSPSPTPKEAP